MKGTLVYCAPEVYPEFDQYDLHGTKTSRGSPHGPHQGGRGNIGRFSRGYDHDVDIWSFGGALFYTLAGRHPFNITKHSISHSVILHDIMTSLLDTSLLCQRNVSESCVHFLSQMLQRQLEVRATIDSLQVHPWLGSSKSAERLD